MTMLRDPEHGCSWDLKQNFQSITSHTLEEVYEVIDSIEKSDYQHLPNELGDLLFQVVFYAQMGKEAELFDFDDVVAEICKKLLTRHPHVFPEATIESFGQKNTLSPEQVEAKWEEIKKQERLQKAPASRDKIATSALDDIPTAFPAMMRARKLQKKAALSGFDWTDIKDVLAKVKEEINELEEAIEESNAENINEEFGDVLFSVINLSRHLKLDSETSLRYANNKFEKRFKLMELLIKSENKDYSALSLQELEEYWIQAKIILKKTTSEVV